MKGLYKKDIFLASEINQGVLWKVVLCCFRIFLFLNNRHPELLDVKVKKFLKGSTHAALSYSINLIIIYIDFDLYVLG